jgi:uncharacterized membrane protein YgcG
MSQISLESVQYSRDLYKWSGAATRTSIHDITFSSGGSPVSVTGLDSPVIFEVAQPQPPPQASQNSIVVDPRTHGACQFWDERALAYSSAGVFMIGVGTKNANWSAALGMGTGRSAQQSYWVCGSQHLTTFTVNGDVLPPNLEVLFQSPSVFRLYKPETAIVPYFLGTFLLLSTLKLWMTEKTARQPHEQYEVWAAAAVNYLAFGTIDATSEIVGRMPSLVAAVRYRMRCDWPLHPEVPVQTLFCHSRSARFLCFILNALLSMAALVFMYDEDKTVQPKSISLDQVKYQVWRSIWVSVLVIPLNTALPILLSMSTNITSSVPLPSAAASGQAVKRKSRNAVMDKSTAAAAEADEQQKLSNAISARGLEFTLFMRMRLGLGLEGGGSDAGGAASGNGGGGGGGGGAGSKTQAGRKALPSIGVEARWMARLVNGLFFVIVAESSFIVLVFGATMPQEKVLLWVVRRRRVEHALNISDAKILLSAFSECFV